MQLCAESGMDLATIAYITLLAVTSCAKFPFTKETYNLVFLKFSQRESSEYFAPKRMSAAELQNKNFK